MQPENAIREYFRRLYINTSDYVKSYMTASDQEMQNSDDPIMDIISSAPSDSLYFIERINLISAVISVTTSFPFLTYLIIYWNKCKPGNDVLKWWIVTNSVLQLLQTPVRLFVYFLLRKFKRENQRTHINVLRRLTSSKGWKLSKRFSLLNYMCFMVGVVVMITTKKDRNNLHLWLIAWTIILSCIFRVLFTIIWFCFFFSYNHDGVFSKKGVPRKFFTEVKSFKYENTLILRNDSCAICLSEFSEKEELLELNCKHVFHWKCAKRWLVQRRLCPLCQRNVLLNMKSEE